VLARLLFLFFAVPLAELAILLMIAYKTHWLVSLVMVLVTGFSGAILIRRQGLLVLRRIQQSLLSGQSPTDPLLDAGLILAAGALLLTPGVLTDIAGISMLIPFIRTWYKRRLVQWFKNHFKISTIASVGGAGFHATAESASSGQFYPGSSNDDDVIDSYVIPDPNGSRKLPGNSPGDQSSGA
jgi:UPF0716 protein FxsA